MKNRLAYNCIHTYVGICILDESINGLQLQLSGFSKTVVPSCHFGCIRPWSFGGIALRTTGIIPKQKLTQPFSDKLNQESFPQLMFFSNPSGKKNAPQIGSSPQGSG